MGELTVAADSNRHANTILSHMIPHHSDPSQKSSPNSGNKVAASGSLATLVMAILTSSALAQSAANFGTQAMPPGIPAAKTEKAAKPVVKEAAPSSIIPSRQVGPDELEPYVASLVSVFSAQERILDPFGQLQDPDAKPIIKTPVASATKRVAPVQATPFVDIVRLIVVTTIMPGEKRFLIGTRSVKQGDQIPLSFRGKQIRVQVTEVTSQQIAFKNLDNGETASRKLDMLPVGMTPGSRGISAPGMTLDRANAPIELETSTPIP